MQRAMACRRRPGRQSRRPAREAAPRERFTEAMKRYDMGSTLATGRLATRKAFGLGLRVAGHAHAGVHVLDADVRNSTFTDWFASDRELAARFSECKIAEQNMASVAVGISAGGRIPVMATFGRFLSRACDQIEMGINSGANLKIVGSHCGISLAAAQWHFARGQHQRVEGGPREPGPGEPVDVQGPGGALRPARGRGVVRQI